ncbi:MAG TPA: metal-dependent transcriptional regulator [Gemmatimonadales bacterium]|nr:metal-dependent transcriptional regulator [Gemmatimonadales bacterium]
MLEPRSTPDPFVALVIFLVAMALLAALFWPRRGFLSRVVRLFRLTERVRLEDALKQLYHATVGGRSATVETLAGSLEVRRGVAVRLVERLTELGLARAENGRLTLTPAGQTYALRMVRTHRLWERYLADRSGLSPAEWHEEAERQEHALSDDQVEALSAGMGHPRYDPHGDPIPTTTGELPAHLGQHLSAFPLGQAAVVVHLEDEPPESFERLLDLGLRPGARLRLLDANPTEVRFRFDGREQMLPSVVADLITVEPLPADVVLDEAPHATLADLPAGGSARVVRISAACQGPQRRRLLDLGVVPGTIITSQFTSPDGDPAAYLIRGALIALRKAQAELIQVDLLPAQAAS